jgi:predicted peptidase
LHDSDHRGEDGRRQLVAGLGPIVAERVRSGKVIDFIALFPQAFAGRWAPESDDGRLFMKVLASVKARYPVDPDRICLTGVSAGASGVWSLAAAYPDQWAAIAPVSGSGDAACTAKIKHIPCWCFQTRAEQTPSPAESRRLIEALRDCGGNPRYTEYAGHAHSSSLTPYADPQLLAWMLSQRRPAGSP